MKKEKRKIFYGSKHKPGEYPYKHGIYSKMYTDRLWTMRQYAGLTSAAESNKRFHYLLKQGVMGLSVAFDLPTQTGYDSDHDLSKGEIGRVGVPISTIEDMEKLFKDIPLDKVSISMTINSTAAILLSMLIVVADKRGIPRSKLRGTIQNDILKEYIARGTYIYPPEPSMRLVTDVFEFCTQEVKQWNTISISGYHIREAGATAAQELGFTFANAISYMKAAEKRGLDLNTIGERVSFFFNSHNDFFEEIAKFRAARIIWSKIMKETFKVKNEKALKCRFHTQTAGSTLQAKEIENNVIRTSMQATAAILGGTQSLHTNSMDEALSLPTQESVKIALRTQQIIAYETNIPNVVDPLAGSYYIESLTEELTKQTFKYINTIKNLGGSIEAINQGYQEDEIAKSAYDYQQKIDNKELLIIGNNIYNDTKIQSNKIQNINNQKIKEQLQKLNNYKSKREIKVVNQALKDLEKKILDPSINIIPFIIKALESKATLGEISLTLKSVFGEYA